MKLHYRRANTKDIHILKSMLYHAIYVPDGKHPVPTKIVNQPDLRIYFENWGQKDDMGWIAFDKGTPIGVAWIRIFQGPMKGYGYIDEEIPELSIALLPKYRGRGIGSKLIDRILDDAKEKHSAISLSVTRENPALRLYQRKGVTEFEISGSSITMIRLFNK